MDTVNTDNRSRAQKVGWGILLVVSALMVLNGVVWFFIGPDRMRSYNAQVAGLAVEEFQQLYPGLAEHLTRNPRQAAIWYAAFGSMALMVSLEGFRRGTRWAWNATWAVAAAPLAIGLVYAQAELGFDNAGLLLIAGVAVIGQLLAREK